MEHENSFVEMVYRLAQGNWNKGYATQAAAALLEYAFSDVRLDQVYAFIETENISSRKVLEKIGMQFRRVISYKGVEVEEFSAVR